MLKDIKTYNGLLSYCANYYLSTEPHEDGFSYSPTIMLEFIRDNKFKSFEHHSEEDVLVLINKMAEMLKERFQLEY